MKKRTKKLFLLGCLLMGGCQAEPCRIGRATDLPLRIVDGHLLTPVMINGKPLTMVLDTGANLTALTTRAAARLGVALELSRVVGHGIGGERTTSFFTTDSLQIGSLQGQHFPILATGFDMRGPHADVDGLLGTDFLSAYDLDLDLPDRKAILFRTLGRCTQPGVVLDEPLYIAPMVRGGNELQFGALVDVSINGKTLRALIDTGAPGTVLFRDAARDVGLKVSDLADDPRFVVHGTGPRAVEAVRHRLAPLTVGEVTVQNLPVAIVDQRSDRDVGMILGMDFLSRVHVWFSFSSRTFVMQYPPKPSPKTPS